MGFFPSFTTAEMDALLSTLGKPLHEQADALARTGFDLGDCAEGLGKLLPIGAVPDPDPRDAVQLLRDERKKLDPERLAQIEAGAPLTAEELSLWRELRLEEIGMDENITRWPYLECCVACDTAGRKICIVSKVTGWHTHEARYELAGLFATGREAERFCPDGYLIA